MNTLLRAGAPHFAFDKVDPDLVAWRKRQADKGKDAAPTANSDMK
jgi:hypothetical protein